MNESELVRTTRTDLNIVPESDPLCTSSVTKILSYIFQRNNNPSFIFDSMLFTIRPSLWIWISRNVSVISIKCFNTVKITWEGQIILSEWYIWYH